MENQVRVNLADSEDVVCDKCGDRRFEPVHLMKKLSPLISPSGKEEFIPIGVMTGFTTIWACYSCGHINDAFLPPAMRADAEAVRKAAAEKQQKKQDGIIASALPVDSDGSEKPDLKLEK